MRRALAFCGLLVMLGSAGAAASAQEVTPISALLSSPDDHDLTTVTIRGEIVGDYGERGDVVWVQVNDDAYVDAPLSEAGELAGTNTGISVRMPGSVPPSYGEPGGHGMRGPIVEVTGVFRDLDPSLGGLTFVDAVSVELVEPARRVSTEPADLASLLVGVSLTVAGLAAFAHRRDLLRRRVSL